MEAEEQRKPRAMIVDDDIMVQQTVAAILELHGYETWRCSDALSAVAMLEHEQPDVLLTDIRMPGMSGTDLLLRLRREGCGFPVIVMTGYADMDAAIDAVKGGAFDFIRKPYDPDQLVQSVNRAVKHFRLLELERKYLERLEQEVQQKTTEMQQALRLKGEFLNNISHEIRTPVNGIVGMLSLARDTENRKELNEYLSYAQFSALQLVRIVDDLVMLAGVMSGSVKSAFAPGSIRDSIDRALKRVTGGVSRQDVGFAVDVGAEVPDCLLLEAVLLEMALFQLFENEMKFADAGTVTIAGSYDVIRSMLMIEVRDSGPGIKSDRLELINEPFIQGDGSHTRSHGGLGLGLSIVAKISSFLGGGFTVESSEGSGSCFRFSIPAKPV